MLSLSPHEARVLGTLIEKALTTPDQYPLSLNAAVNGCNQKNNRDPVMALTEDEVFDALESLRAKQLVVRVEQMGARVHKFKHTAIETLKVRTAELAVLAELLLRGPQTLGELRGRASRMSPLESLDRARDMIRALQERPEPYAKEISPAPGSRAERYVQLLSPDAHAIDESSTSFAPASMTASSSSEASVAATEPLLARIESLEADLATIRAAVSKLAIAAGESDPFAPV